MKYVIIITVADFVSVIVVVVVVVSVATDASVVVTKSIASSYIRIILIN